MPKVGEGLNICTEQRLIMFKACSAHNVLVMAHCGRLYDPQQL